VFGDNNAPEITFFGNSFVFGKVDPVTKVKLCRSFTIERGYIERKIQGPSALLLTAPSTDFSKEHV
jgi:hypothetical protein